MTTLEHRNHISPLRIYFEVALALLLLTAFTVWIATVDFGPWNMVIAMGVAVFKGSLVVLYFMHVLYDNKIYAIVFLSALLFLGIFIVFTMFDELNRGQINSETEHPIRAYAEIYEDNGALKIDEEAERLKAFQLENGVGPITELMALDPIDPSLIESGASLYAGMCASCHKIGEPSTASPLENVTVDRSPEFVMNAILNHEEMAERVMREKDLPDQRLTSDALESITRPQARALLEFLRSVAPETDEVEGDSEEWIVE